tara:strand:+ start:223 stop:810 length:588 start_codon:yes stop_codon:yes gene_type:complete
MSITINHQTNDLSIAGGGAPTLGGSLLGGGALEHISTTSFSTSTATVDIALPTGYDSFEISFDLYSSGKAYLYMAFSEDSGSSFLVSQYTTYSQNNSYGGSLTWTSAPYSGAVAIDRAKYLVGAIRLFNASASTNTIFRGECNAFSGVSFANGAIMNSTGMSTTQTARINTVQMRPQSPNVWNSGKFTLYGIKES